MNNNSMPVEDSGCAYKQGVIKVAPRDNTQK